ncbi:MAG: TonB-dependent receptor [Alphaproteobacteria bacterium]|nr:TonB-dependent receptor [Alphaproteobacteria bacterium]
MRKKSYWLYSAACLGLLAISPAHAQDAAQDQPDVIYVTAARVPVLPDDATVSITRLGEDELEARGPLFLADIVRAAPGLAVSRSGPAGTLTQIRARGSEANHVLVLIDGVEAASPFSGEADFANFLFDDLESVEIARGEQSVLWGADAIGGVIALTTRRPDQGHDWAVRAEAGSFDTYRATGRYGYGFDQGEIALSGGHFESGGIDISGLGGEEDDYRNQTLNLTGRREGLAGWTLEGTARWIGTEGNADSDIDFDGALNDVDRERRSEQVFARLRLSREDQYQGVSLSHDANLRLTDELSRNYANGVRTGRTLGQRRALDYQLTARWESGVASHRLTGLIAHETDDLKNDAGPGNGANQTREIETLAFAGDYGLAYRQLDLTASVRHEDNELFDDAFTWRLGAAYAFDAIDGRAWFSFGEAVKNPGLFELYGFFPGFFVGNADLTPESSQGWEIGWTQSLLEGAASWSAVYFDSELDDEIFTDFGVFPATARNATQTSTRQGIELQADWAMTSELNLFGSATWLESEQNGAAEIRRPEQLASVTLDWRPGAAWSASVSADYTGEQTDTDFGTFQTVTLDAYTLFSAQLRWTVRPGAEIYVRGENLLDEDYQDVFGYQTSDRGLYVGLRLGSDR